MNVDFDSRLAACWQSLVITNFTKFGERGLIIWMDCEVGFEFVFCLVEIVLLQGQEAERRVGATDGWIKLERLVQTALRIAVCRSRNRACR